MMSSTKYYGTITHWFANPGVGAIRAENTINKSILLLEKHWLAQFKTPAIGDEVSFGVIEDEKHRLCAVAVRLLPALAEGQEIEIVLDDWDIMQNGGYGTYQRSKPQPIFMLGQFLRDQTYVPQAGDKVTGRLKKHNNQHWMLTDIEVLKEAPVFEPSPEDIRQAKLREEEAAKAEAQAAAIAAAQQNKSAAESQAGFPLNVVLHGKVAQWHDEKGFGFIQSGRRQVFFHISAYHYRNQRPQVGEDVSFVCQEAPESGKQRAWRVVCRENEALIGSSERIEGKGVINYSKVYTYATLSAIFLIALAVICWKWAVLDLILSLITYTVYHYDKNQAQKMAGKSGYAGRISENHLHQLALLGGWPGALIARFQLNHKTTKASFVVGFWLTVIANITAVIAVWHFAPDLLARLNM